MTTTDKDGRYIDINKALTKIGHCIYEVTYVIQGVPYGQGWGARFVEAPDTPEGQLAAEGMVKEDILRRLKNTEVKDPQAKHERTTRWATWEDVKKWRVQDRATARKRRLAPSPAFPTTPIFNTGNENLDAALAYLSNL